MTDRPILFSGPMVRALLEGRKTQTRRVIPVERYEPLNGYESTGRLIEYERQAGYEKHGLEFVSKEFGLWDAITNPNGRSAWYIPIKHRVGDRLWVRESWQAHSWATDCVTIRYRAETKTKGFTDQIEQITYPDGNKNAFKFIACKGPDHWRPSIHMPRWASRLTLVVTDVRVQRLQEISDDDALSEGVEVAIAPIAGRDIDIDGQYWPGGPQRMFKELWNSINGPDAWDVNPWVAATTFEVHKVNIDQIKEAA